MGTENPSGGVIVVREWTGEVATIRAKLLYVVASSDQPPTWIRLHPALHAEMVRRVDNYDPAHLGIRSLGGVPVRRDSYPDRSFFEEGVRVIAQCVWEDEGWIVRVVNVKLEEVANGD